MAIDFGILSYVRNAEGCSSDTDHKALGGGQDHAENNVLHNHEFVILVHDGKLLTTASSLSSLTELLLHAEHLFAT